MKTQKLPLGFLLFSTLLFLGTTAFAQRLNSPFGRHDHPAHVRFFHQRYLQGGRHSLAPLPNLKRVQKPTQSHYRLKAMAENDYDGVQFTPSDSAIYFYSGSRHDDWLINWVAYSVPGPNENLLGQELIEHTDSEHYYSWNNGPGVYQFNGKMLSTLGTSGNVLSQTRLVDTGTGWFNEWKHIYTYDVQNNLTSKTVENSNGMSWVNNYKVLYQYDANNNMVLETNLSWNTGSTSWDSAWKHSYTYNAQNQFIKEIVQDWNSGSWENNEKLLYSYSGSNLSSSLKLAWNTSTTQWDSIWRDDYTYNSSGEQTKQLHWVMNSGSWVEDYQLLYDYDGAGNNTSMIQQYWNSGSWVYDYKYTYTYTGSNWTKTVNQDWVDSLSQLVNNYKVDNTYNSSNLLTKQITSTWNGSSWEYGPLDTWQDFYYEQYQPAGIATVMKKADFQLYPNPTKNQLTIEMANHKAVNSIKIVNISGQTVYQSRMKLHASEVTLPVTQLSDGIYVLQIQSGHQQGSKTFVVKH